MRICKGSWCGASNCSNNKGLRPELSFFRFPKDETRCKEWVIRCKRNDLLQKSSIYLYTNCFLCAEHFDSSQFMNFSRNSLVWNAIPTIFNGKNPSSLIANEETLTSHRKNSNSTISEITLEVSLPKEVEEGGQGCDSSGNKINNRKNSKSIQTCFSNYQVKSTATQTDCRLDHILNLKKKFDKLQAKCQLMQKKRKEIDPFCKNFTKKYIKWMASIPPKYMKKEVVELIINQMNFHNMNKGFRWTNDFKNFCVRFLNRSPSGYKFLKEYLMLPTVKTLQRFSKNQQILKSLVENDFHNYSK